uniref:Secreted protein n=1 Tax=Heterorhabditis bacteriophora TaxID=37862 RepID=A0A1I7WII7_HETBA
MPSMLGTISCFVYDAIQLSSSRFLAQTSVRYGIWKVCKATRVDTDCGSNPPSFMHWGYLACNFYLGCRRASERPYGLAPVRWWWVRIVGSHRDPTIWDPKDPIRKPLNRILRILLGILRIP